MLTALSRLETHPHRLPILAVQQGLFLVLFAALQIADIVTTNHALAAGSAWEVNPVMMFTMLHLGPFWWLPKVALFAFAIFAARRIRRSWPLHMIVAMLLMLVANNMLYW